MTKVIAIANQKGGVGKTSTAVNLGAGLVRQGYDVLLIDLDSQANLTMALGYQNPDDMEYTISNVLHKAVKEEVIDPTEGILTTTEGIDLMPANVQLSGLELSLINEYGREVVLKQYIDEVRLNYDYILIDCAPSLSVLTVNALVAADSVLIPTQPQYFSMAGIQMFYDTFSKIRKKMNPSLFIEGVLVTMWDSNHSLIRFAEFLSKAICFYGSPKRSERSVEGNCSKELLGHRFDHTFAGICGICGIYGISGTHLFYIINIFPKISSFFNTCFMGS